MCAKSQPTVQFINKYWKAYCIFPLNNVIYSSLHIRDWKFLGEAGVSKKKNWNVCSFIGIFRGIWALEKILSVGDFLELHSVSIIRLYWDNKTYKVRFKWERMMQILLTDRTHTSPVLWCFCAVWCFFFACSHTLHLLYLTHSICKDLSSSCANQCWMALQQNAVVSYMKSHTG